VGLFWRINANLDPGVKRFMKTQLTALIAALIITVSVRQTALAQPVTTHPRLFFRSSDLPRLRAWANAGNPIYNNLVQLAGDARRDMDAGRVPQRDTGSSTYVEFPSEMYAELFAFMSLISPDPAVQDDYAQRARTLLMYVINQAAMGAASRQPFRETQFSINDRSRWQGEGFPLTVDWIYPYLSATDKASIRTVFLRWIEENKRSTITDADHPEPINMVNNPQLVSNPARARWAGNNYFTAHMRNIGLMAMALDAADDPDSALRNGLSNATGAWLYMVDNLMRNDSRGGLFPEGFEYGPRTIGSAAQFLLALRTAGLDDPSVHGPQAVLTNNPFWKDVVPAFLHSMSPATATHPWLGTVYQPAWYGDGANYWAMDFIDLFGPLGLYDSSTGNADRLQSIRWMQANLGPGGAAGIGGRVRDSNFFLHGILYFLLFDPDAATPDDPRPAQPTAFYAQGLGRILARTDWTPNANWFTYKLSWSTIDHQLADGNQFEFYRKGEWLTQERTGYSLDYGASMNHNSLTLENNPTRRDPGDYRNVLWSLGSQWGYVSSGDPKLVATSMKPSFIYALGDATNLYNAAREGSTDIVHASRSIIWQAPDHIIVYDRAISTTAGRFKRFWLNVPAQPSVSQNLSTMGSPNGQMLFITTLLPQGAAITSEPSAIVYGDVAEQEAMRFRLRVEAPGGPQSTRFLHVLQGADAGAAANPATLIASTGGTPFEGALVDNTVTLFPVSLDTPFASLTYSVPAAVSVRHRITGLTPGAGYRITSQTAGNTIQVTILPNGSDKNADDGGVLEF
jgi:hypothetical protein